MTPALLLSACVGPVGGGGVVQAVEDCGKAIALDSQYVKAFRKRAESLYALGEWVATDHDDHRTPTD